MNCEIRPGNEKYYQTLERIRKSGICNMWCAAEPLRQICPELSSNAAKNILLEWIYNYDALNRKYKWQEV